MRTGDHVTLTVQLHGRRDRRWVHLTAWGSVQGKYQSLCELDVRWPHSEPPRDAEELAEEVILALAALV